MTYPLIRTGQTLEKPADDLTIDTHWVDTAKAADDLTIDTYWAKTAQSQRMTYPLIRTGQRQSKAGG